MSLHDRYARQTPFELAFPEPEKVGRLVSEVVEESESRSVDPSHPGVFATLGAVGDLIEEFRSTGAPEAAVPEYAALAYQAFHFERASRPLYLLETEATREILGDVGDLPAPEPPTSSGYLQLPQHLIWMEASEGGPPESVDGLFWTVSASGHLQTLTISGLLGDPPAFRALPLPAAPVSDAPTWLGFDARGDGTDYVSHLPGHELDRLYSVRTAGEVLKLVARFFAFTGRSDCVQEGRGPGVPGSGEPRPSSLAYTRVKRAA